MLRRAFTVTSALRLATPFFGQLKVIQESIKSLGFASIVNPFALKYLHSHKR